ncbi:hypothetical protein [Janthinobacterium lividum]|uniref:hypothetical protein n=1 Tax=Janthinobacterium lividum TaxID=29581 RepID=UPI000874B6A1|nr:hypothetical protein [Janthinobacterium lividum]MCC7713401.1 hypothetical protein [Janthinobacterium lividum]OEZ59018.1 hypothetical protein JANLI_17740 [Janthinobacterium lividum]WQE26466.1 hypothetical protein U0004_15825 [Janthinobacterium lividum]STQ97357.1 Uncharacterised protein [Janthinobacterium lividum]
MKAKIEIVHIVQVAGTSRKTGNDYDIRNAQCVVRNVGPDGVVKPMIGVLSLPARYKDLPKGVYMIEFDAAVGQNSRIVSEVADVKQWDGAAVEGPVRTVTIEVLSVTSRSGFSKKSLKDYNMLFADCLVHKVDRETGEVALLVGELLVPDTFKDVVPGLYEVEFEIAIGQDKRIGGRVVGMVPKVATASKAPQVPAVPSSASTAQEKPVATASSKANPAQQTSA